MSNWSHIYSIVSIETADTYAKGEAMRNTFEVIKRAPAIEGSEGDAWVVPIKTVVEECSEPDRETFKAYLAVFGDLRDRNKKDTLKEFSYFIRYLVKNGMFVKVHTLKVE